MNILFTVCLRRIVVHEISQKPCKLQVDVVVIKTSRVVAAGSGYIDFDEFVAVMNEFMPSDDADQLRQAFSMMDRDGSGKISAGELKQVMRSIGERLSDEDVDEIIREIDMDGDGEVDYEGRPIQPVADQGFSQGEGGISPSLLPLFSPLALFPPLPLLIFPLAFLPSPFP